MTQQVPQHIIDAVAKQCGLGAYGPAVASIPQDILKGLLAKPGGLASGNTGILYDSHIWKANTAFPVGEQALFQIPLDQPGTELGGTTKYTKTLLHTNMTDQGKLPVDVIMKYWNLMIHVVAVANQPTFNTAADVVGSPSTTDGQNAAFNAPATVMQSIQNNTIVRFSVQQAIKYVGPAFAFPSKYGISGQSSALGSGLTDGAANNGFGQAVELEPNWLDSGRPFKCTLHQPTAQTSPTTAYLHIYAILFGKIWGPLIG